MNVIEKLRRNMMKLAIVSSVISSGHILLDNGVAFIDDRTNYNFCRVGEASLLSAKLTESEDVICVDLFDNGMDTHVPLELLDTSEGGIYKVTYDLEDLKEVERVNENELLGGVKQ